MGTYGIFVFIVHVCVKDALEVNINTSTLNKRASEN